MTSPDIADNGRPAEYEQARKLLVSPYRLVTCPGNDDVRAAFEEVLLGREPTGGPVNAVLEVDGRAGRDVRLVPAGPR